MVKNRREYYFTHHLRERFLQRTNKKFHHLQTCRKENCDECDDLREQIRFTLSTEGKQVDTEIARRLGLSEENRSYINNSGFMSWYYEKYGFDKRFQFLIHDEILFIVVIDKGKKVVVTCVPSKTHLAGKHALRPKFKGKGSSP